MKQPVDISDDVTPELLARTRGRLVARLYSIETWINTLKKQGGSPLELERLRLEHADFSRQLRWIENLSSIEQWGFSPVEELTIPTPPQFGERILLLVLHTKEERINIPGDLEEEYRGIAKKHGARYAKLWYYKQVAGSAWPMIRKAVGWGLLASIGAWIRRLI